MGNFLRVIAGSAGGLPLRSPKGIDLRPTQDRVKQSLFSSLGERVVGASVLDLYAGTGALGIEALSRGANHAIFVDEHRACAACIRENLIHTHLHGDVIAQDALQFVRQWNQASFDLVLADPPYDKCSGDLSEHSLLEALSKIVTPNGCLIWEHFYKQRCDPVRFWQVRDAKRYGETMLTFLELLPQSATAD